MKIEEGDRKPRKAECQLPPAVLFIKRTNNMLYFHTLFFITDAHINCYTIKTVVYILK
jgi:hypothetical protein